PARAPSPRSRAHRGSRPTSARTATRRRPAARVRAPLPSAGTGCLRQASRGSLKTVSELDGTWNVRRTGGLLPPLAGVRKEIHGTHGKTPLFTGIVGVPFDVVCLELHYWQPLSCFVDILTPRDGALAGRVAYRHPPDCRRKLTANGGG